MKLTKKQKKIVRKINSPEFSVEYLERYYAECPSDLPFLNASLVVLSCAKANAFMAAVNGIIKAKR